MTSALFPSHRRAVSIDKHAKRGQWSRTMGPSCWMENRAVLAVRPAIPPASWLHPFFCLRLRRPAFLLCFVSFWSFSFFCPRPRAPPRFCASLTECRPPSAPPHPGPSSSFFVADFPACCLCALVWACVYWCACLPRPFCRSRLAPRGRLSKMFSISVSKLCRPKERDSLPGREREQERERQRASIKNK